jgi:hypothetical protein
MRRLVVVALAAAALGTTAAPASARCAPDADPVVCAVTCLAARLAGAYCRE